MQLKLSSGKVLVRGLFADLKYDVDSQPSGQSPLVFNISQAFPWQFLDLCLVASHPIDLGDW